MRIPLPPVAMPPEAAAIAQEYADGLRTPVEPRDAATVVLTRSGPSGPEVYLLSRHRTMSFAAGMAVFPGGGVDPRDAAEETPWAGPSAQDWAERLGTIGYEIVCGISGRVPRLARSSSSPSS